MNSRWSRTLIGMPLFASMALLSPASVPARCDHESGAAQAIRRAPSPLDYVVLASLADSSSLLAMSTYNGRSLNQ